MQAVVPLWKVSSAPPRRRTKPGPQGPGFVLVLYAPPIPANAGIQKTTGSPLSADHNPKFGPQFGSRPLALITALAAGRRRKSITARPPPGAGAALGTNA